MDAKYKIGQILTANKDYEIEQAVTGAKKTIPKGAKGIIGADKMLHYFENSSAIVPMGKKVKYIGYDTTGIAEYIWYLLCCRNATLCECVGYEVDDSQVIEDISECLDEIGF